MIKVDASSVLIKGSTNQLIDDIGRTIIALFNSTDEDEEVSMDAFEKAILGATIIGRCEIDDLSFLADPDIRNDYNELTKELIKTINIIRDYINKKARG